VQRKGKAGCFRAISADHSHFTSLHPLPILRGGWAIELRRDAGEAVRVRNSRTRESVTQLSEKAGIKAEIFIAKVDEFGRSSQSLHYSCDVSPARTQNQTNPRTPWFATVASLSGMVQSKEWLFCRNVPLPRHGRGFQNRSCGYVQALSRGATNFILFHSNQIHGYCELNRMHFHIHHFNQL
jgi:hypothetical protein